MSIESLMNDLELTATDWHDGRLKGITYAMSDGVSHVLLSLEIYAEHDASQRHDVCFKFVNIKEYIVSAVGSELQLHEGAGNIIQGRLNDSEAGHVDLSVYLTGAYIRILSVAVEKCQSVDPPTH
jgi:hypothetical protein